MYIFYKEKPTGNKHFSDLYNYIFFTKIKHIFTYFTNKPFFSKEHCNHIAIFNFLGTKQHPCRYCVYSATEEPSSVCKAAQ